MIDVYGSARQYLDHLAPIWLALPDEVRGDVLFERRDLASHPLVVEANGVRRKDSIRGARIPRAKRVLVASHRDFTSARRMGWGVALLEHGAGQSYSDGDSHPSYPGGSKREGIGLFLCTNDDVARRNEALYGSRSVVVGSPRLSKLRKLRAAPRRQDRPTLALTFHWDCRVSIESFWALPFYEKALVDLALSWPGKVIGHAHPRVFAHVSSIYRSAGIEAVETFEEVVRRADVLSFDNTSAGFEAAALGIPVVVLDSPQYRTDVDHGLRFWRWADIGPRVTGKEATTYPASLGKLWSERADESFFDSPRFVAARGEMTREVFPDVPVEVAVNALREWAGI